MIHRRLRRVRLLFRGRGLLPRSWLTLLLIKAALQFLPFQVVWRGIRRMACPVSSPRLSVGQIVWGLNVASRHVPGGVTCLPRALAAYYLLRRQGYWVQLRIGTSKQTDGLFAAHAWIEYEDQVVVGHLSNLSDYTPFPSLERVK